MEEQKAVDLIVGIIKRMPATNAATLRLLIRFLAKVSARSEENQMTARNLGEGSNLVACPV